MGGTDGWHGWDGMDGWHGTTDRDLVVELVGVADAALHRKLHLLRRLTKSRFEGMEVRGGGGRVRINTTPSI